MTPRRRRPVARRGAPIAQVIGPPDTTLLDIIDNVLNRGVVLTAEATIGIAGIDLIYLRLSALLCAADRLLPGEESPRGA